MKFITGLQVVRLMSKSKKAACPQLTVKSAIPVFVNKNGNIVMQLLVKPGAKISGITGIEEEGIGVQISARPVDGEANCELINYISKLLGLKKNEISLDRGLKSRQKVLQISQKGLTVEDIIEKLKVAMEK